MERIQENQGGGEKFKMKNCSLVNVWGSFMNLEINSPDRTNLKGGWKKMRKRNAFIYVGDVIVTPYVTGE